MKKRLLLFVFVLISLVLVWRIIPHERADQQHLRGVALDDSVSEVQCKVPIHLDAADEDQEERYTYYYMVQHITFNPLPSWVGPDLSPAGDIIQSYGFNESCPLVFNHLLLAELYPHKIVSEYLERNREFEKQSAFSEEGMDSCDVSLALPLGAENMPFRVRTHMEQRFRTFEKIVSETVLNYSSRGFTLRFSSPCDELMSDYFRQRLFPHDYYRTQWQ